MTYSFITYNFSLQSKCRFDSIKVDNVKKQQEKKKK